MQSTGKTDIIVVLQPREGKETGMKVREAFNSAFRCYFSYFRSVMKFLLIELCIMAAALSPLLFLTEKSLKMLALLAFPLWILLVLPARHNAAETLVYGIRGGNLISSNLISLKRYGGKLLHGLKRTFFMLLWTLPLIGAAIVAKINISGDIDGLTLLRNIKQVGGGDLMTGVLILIAILVFTLLLIAFGCAFHSGARFAFALNDKKLPFGNHGKLILVALCGLISFVPLIAAAAVVVFRYIPVLENLSGLVMGTYHLPDTKVTVLIGAVGILLTLPLIPLRSLMTAALMNGLKS